MKKKAFFIILIIDIFVIQYTNGYLFSIIIPIYNTERYLDDSINSIINQSIGFNNIQLILVNDGSVDNSEKICLKYKKKYPNNIIYIKITHGGPSKSRNIGLSYAKGLFINFLDSDDKWGKNAFNYAFLFFKFNKDVDIISARIKYFEARKNFHFLDYKFTKTRKVNLDKDYNCIQLHAASSFFRYKSIIGKKFDENLFYGEDAKFISKILLYKPIIGFLKKAIYYYRKRADSSSAIQNSHKHYYYYFQTLEKLIIYLINKSKELYNKIVPFIQFYISYEFLFRISGEAYKYLDINNYKKYCLLIGKIIKEIDEKYILEQKILSSDIKLFALSIKYSRDIRYDISIKKNLMIYSDYVMIDIKKQRNIIEWKIIEIEGNILYLKGEERFWLPRDKYFYYCKIGNNIFYPKYHYYENLDFVTLYGISYKGRIISFDVSLDIKRNEKLNFFIAYDNNIIEIYPKINPSIHLPPISKSYYSTKNYIIKNVNNNLVIYIYNSILIKKFEEDYQKQLEKLKKHYLVKIRAKNRKIRTNVKIWLINDRRNEAGDNGEYFFRYLLTIKPKELFFYFVIQKNCPDYKRLKKFGNIVEFKSVKYLNLFLKADKLISSVSDEWVRNPFGKDGKYLIDLYKFEYIYLQSDIINDDFSNSLNRIKSNFDMIFTTSKREYNLLIQSKYGYNIKNVIINGLSRFDNLKMVQSEIQAKKMILIYLNWGLNSKSDENSEKVIYFKFYNKLINDKTLLLIMKENNFKGILCLNHNFKSKNYDFHQNQLFQVKKICYRKTLFAEASLLITDYSRFFLDFGYMNKPIIYSQFEHEEFKYINLYKRNFYYEKNGFGPVCYDLECIIKNIILVIKNKNTFRIRYFKRIKSFLKYSYEQNCKRIYLLIRKKRNNSYYLKEYRYIEIHFSIIIFLISIIIRLKRINILI